MNAVKLHMPTSSVGSTSRTPPAVQRAGDYGNMETTLAEREVRLKSDIEMGHFDLYDHL